MLGIAINLDTAFSPYIVSGNLLHICRVIIGRDQGGGAPAGRGGRGGFRGGRGGARGGFGGAGGPVASGPFSDGELRELKRKLRNSKVRVNHRTDRRPFVVAGFGQPAGRHTVSIADRKTKRGAAPSPKEVAAAAAKGEKIATKRPDAPQQTMSVADYFFKTYRIKVDPNLQVVELRGGQFVPVECLDLLPGTLVPSTQLSANQSATMINIAAKPPAERRAGINLIRSEADFGEGSRLDSWGIEVDAQPMRLTGRVLAPPKVHYHLSSAKATPFVNFGSWNLKDSKFLQPNKPLERWGVVVFDNPRETPPAAVQQFFRTLMNQACLRGMSVRAPQPKAIEYWDGREDTQAPIRRVANAILVNNPTNPSRAPPQILFFILRDPKMYDEVKRKAAFDFPVAIPTQPRRSRIRAALTSTAATARLCLKLNIKLGGVNSEVKQQDLPKFGKTTMMLGADVTHPTGFGAPRAGEDVPPSIAAVVATTDGSGNLYASQVREQVGRKEFITELKEMTVIHAKEWIKQMKGQRPTQVIVWRDGVSEGQLAPVVQSEIMQIKAAFREIDPTWNPKLTYVVCAKRCAFATSSFPALPLLKLCRAGTTCVSSPPIRRARTWIAQATFVGLFPSFLVFAPFADPVRCIAAPGVVVDTTITHPYLFEFYLQAHAGLKGTAKDEIGFGSDQLEKLANSLCFNFGRATRSVSLVPIAYYADIVAFKARSYVQEDDAATTSTGIARALARDRDFIQKKLDRELAGQQYAKMWWV
ncbi:SPOSA6832_04106, partial [Sporobolomyces salmonicolor]